MDTDPQGSDPFADLVNSLGPEPEEAIEEIDAAEPEEDQEEAQEEATEAVEASSEDLEFDGKKLAIPAGTPPELVAAVKALAADLKGNFTRKTQEVAENRKALEQRTEAIQHQEALLSANFAKAVEFKSVQDRLSQFEQIDWQTLADTDPGQATKLNLAYQGLQREAAKLYRDLQSGESQRQKLSAQQLQQTLQEGQKELAKRIPKWNANVAKSISDTAQDYGFSAEELSRVADPRLVHALHDAMQWRKLQADRPNALQKVAQAPKVIRPGAVQPKTNNAALDRLKKSGRIEDLASLL